MRLVSIRDLRTKSAQIWRELPKEREIVVTSNGKPIGILSATSEETLEQTLSTARRIRAIEAVARAQMESVKRGTDKMSLDEINRIIKDVRKKRRR